KTPIIFSMVNFPKSLPIAEGKACGVSMDISIDEFFRTLKDINPNIRNVYSFYSTDEGEYIAGEGKYRDLQNKLIYHTKKIVNPAEFEEQLKTLKGKADAFYMINDPLFNRARFQILSDFCKQNKIVLMTSFPSLVKLGATFAISPDYSKIGVMTGNMSNRIIEKKSNCLNEGVASPDQSSLYVNNTYAKSSGIELPETVLKKAKLTRFFNAGVNLMNDGKYKSAKIVFEAILQRDPENQAAQSYLNLLIERLTSAKTKDLLEKADHYFDTKRYSLAMAEYKTVSRINPNIKYAEERYKESVRRLSEEQRTQASYYAAHDRPFEAIRTYQQSIATLPSNTRAVAELANLRAQERKKIPVYLKNGIDEYNKRNYASAQPIFENILLVDNGNKQATEYLRLSKKKREAVLRLKEKLKDLK
ncbi:MAG: peptide ABC transporter substrate-binding protein, partial [Leptospiraceae bacterium]|nr:peptide ABC transporter substrate-binding protein [Leptospiraceae bacterium]